MGGLWLCVMNTKSFENTTTSLRHNKGEEEHTGSERSVRAGSHKRSIIQNAKKCRSRSSTTRPLSRANGDERTWHTKTRLANDFVYVGD